MKIKKKWLIFFISLVLVTSVFFTLAYLDLIEFDAFATHQTVGIEVVIDDNAPDMTVYYPLNDTYNYKTNIYLHYLVTDQSPISNVWYNLNNAASNTTLSENTTFNAASGSNTITVYANDSLNHFNSTTVTFFVNMSKKDDIIIPSAFNTPGADTTDTSQLTKSQLESISNFTLHNPDSGKILFTESINLSDDGKSTGARTSKLINISAYVNISHNRIFIDTTNLPNLNKSATLRLYNLTFSNPHIIMDNETCPATVCTKVSYANGELVFNVTHFTEFKAAETTSQASPETTTPGGGRGGGTSGKAVAKQKIAQKPLEFSEPKIHLKLKNPSTLTKTLIVYNPNDFDIDIKLALDPAIDIVAIEEEYYTRLPAKETKAINLNINISNNIHPSTYASRLIIVTSDGTTEIIPIIIDYSTGKPVATIDAQLPDEFETAGSGSKLCIDLTIVSITSRTLNATLNYLIMDTKGSIAARESEKIILDSDLKKTVCLKLPKNLPEGDYIFSAELEHSNGKIVSSIDFKVQGSKVTLIPWSGTDEMRLSYILIATSNLLLLASAGLIMRNYFIRKRKKRIFSKGKWPPSA